MTITTNARHDRRLRHGRRCWDLVSGMHERSSGVDRILDAALPHLDLQPGQTVLDIGCGAGNAFARLRDAVAPGGRVIGVDYSPRMVARAQRRIESGGWTDVEVRHADWSGTDTPVEPGTADRAIAFASLSAMPDVPAAVRNAHDALRPGGLLFVFDMKLRPEGWSSLLIRLCSGVYRLTAGWTGIDVLDTARAAFAEVDVPGFPTSNGGTTAQHENGWPPLTMFVARG